MNELEKIAALYEIRRDARRVVANRHGLTADDPRVLIGGDLETEVDAEEAAMISSIVAAAEATGELADAGLIAEWSEDGTLLDLHTA
ncbi:MAG TPA: hypothetical protein VNL74_00975 [Methylococcus sp.]|nr:hypothetical protein [Methylococcus sp.]